MAEKYKNEKLVLALGFFDGIHLGHRQLIKTAQKIAKEKNYKSGIMSFETHPLYTIFSAYAPKLITTNEQKIKIAKSLGMDYVFINPFTEHLMHYEPEDFIEHYLMRLYNVRHLVVGYNYNFGYKGKGDINLLKKLGERFGFEVTVVMPYIIDQTSVSSTIIREYISSGKVKRAQDFLGRPYTITGTIGKGKGLGHQHAVPTANLNIDKNIILPSSGVYYTTVHIGEETYDGLTNLGFNPTFEQHPYTIETYIYDFDRDIYNKKIDLTFNEKIRGEIKFNSLDELFARIKQDIEYVNQKYRNVQQKGNLMKQEMSKVYDPKVVERKIYSWWQDQGYFKPEVHKDGKPFTIMMPPPNITGQLHMGHAFDDTLQDTIIRFRRMQGYAALWLPGMDHASIATEVKVVDKIRKEEGKTKEDLGREEFLKRAWDWADTYKKRIREQITMLGASCDWDRERFTMDEGCSKAVKETFVDFYNKGLIYKGSRIINWCPDCQTALSEAEVEYQEQEGHLWHIRYQIAGTDEYVVIATTRPETMLGDSGVAVNPNDERYQHLVGKNVILPLLNKEIPVVADDYVDMAFGTGVVKMTPAHDPNDYAVGKRHQLEEINVMNEDGTMNALAGKYAGMDRYDCRKAVLEDLEKEHFLVKVENHTHNVGQCYRCGTTVETMTSEQWFIAMEDLVKPALAAVKNDELQFIPKRFSKIYCNWLENIHDWCISRQLWWGHQIPAYYCEECGELIVSKSAPDKCSKCGSTRIKQDPDVLDTWFSSGLWPFSTLGWPEKTSDLEKFYPNNVLVTGYDIIFFWVARMVFMGIDKMGEIPFDDVYIHGLIRDAEGRKMSKSLGNGIDPLEIIDKYSADALRFAIITGNSAGTDIRWQEDKVLASRNFLNKIWNAARFVMMYLDDDIMERKVEAESHMTIIDHWILSRMNTIIEEVTSNMEKYELGIAAQKIYDFAWNEFCDWYIELVKPRLYSDDEASKLAVTYTLNTVLINILKLLHPVTPFITEEIYSFLPGTEDAIIISKWPESTTNDLYLGDVEKVQYLIDVIRAVRNIRAEKDVPNSKKTQLFIRTDNAQNKTLLEENAKILKKLASISEVALITADEIKQNYVSAVIGDTELFISMDELVDKEKEILRLNTEKEKLDGELDRVSRKLSNKGFTEKAPEKVVEEERQKQKHYQEMMDKVLERLNYYKNA